MKAELTPEALKILQSRYLKKDEYGVVIETPDEMFHRVANGVAHGNAENAQKYYELMSSLVFLPNSPTLMNAGTAHPQMSACFVLPVPDDMHGIFKAVHDAAIIFKSGGGVGYDFSQLRPEGDIVKSTGGTASGPISFMRVFNEATEVVHQGGRRRGASMAILRCDHPDIEKFITCKDKEGDFANFNISVGITDAFMTKVEGEADWDLTFDGKVYKTIKARHLFDLITSHAWKNGEPGAVFLDTINSHNPVPELGDIAATNPCGEQPLHPYFSCVLGSIDVSKLIGEDGLWSSSGLTDIVFAALDFLDDVVTTAEFPIPEISEVTKKYRNLGLGIMGLADMLALKGVPYDSDQALTETDFIINLIQDASERWRRDRKKDNRALTCIAPTGTISMIANCSSGCEPFFGIAYTKKNVLGGTELTQVTPTFEKVLARKGIRLTEQMKKQIADDGGSVQNLGIPQEIKGTFKTALEISPFRHIAMQSTIQRIIDAAVSKTINMSNSATVEDVQDVYLTAWLNNCKGITIYRSGSRQVEVISSKKQEPSLSVSEPKIGERGRILEGATSRTATPFGMLWTTLNVQRNKPAEVFCTVGKAGSDVQAITEGYGRLLSLALRHGIPLDEIISQLEGIGGNGKVGFGKDKVSSLPDGIAKALEGLSTRVKCGEGLPIGEPQAPSVPNPKYDLCPECGEAGMVNEAGCEHCVLCNYSRC